MDVVEKQYHNALPTPHPTPLPKLVVSFTVPAGTSYIVRHFLSCGQARTEWALPWFYRESSLLRGWRCRVGLHIFSLAVAPLLMSSFFPLLPNIINKRVRICLSLLLYRAGRPPRRRLIKRHVHLSLSLATSLSFPFSRTPNATHRMGKRKREREIISTTLVSSATENMPYLRAAPFNLPFLWPSHSMDPRLVL
jgi:hypothetical protein